MLLNLNDVWIDASSQIGFFTSETWEQIPAKAGIYAWFYPLRIRSTKPDDFVDDVNSMFFYDAACGGQPMQHLEAKFSWEKINVDVARVQSEHPESEHILRQWRKVLADEKAHGELKEAVMKASILMPPLYVGRTDNLHDRYRQHTRSSNGDNDLHKRFSEFAEGRSWSCKISDLLFVCITTTSYGVEEATSRALTDVIEHIMKLLSKPVYGIR